MGGIQLAPLMTKIQVDIKGFKNDMEKVKTEAVTKADEVSKKMESTIKTGESMSKVGGKLTKTITLPLVGAGVAATKMAIDYESSFAKVSTLLDKNIVDYGKYKSDILDASSKSKVAVGEFSEAVYSSISAGVDQTKAIQFTTDAMKLAKGGFTDGAKAVDVMTTAINGYSLKTEDATKISDMLITTQNLGKTTVDELASSMGAVIPVASSVNFGMDELSASYAQLTKNGIATAESGTYLKSMLSELGKSGSITDKALRELTGKGFADLKKEGKSTSEILNTLDGYAKKNGQTLKDMFGSVEAGSAALVLGRKDGAEYNEMLDAMQKSAGATDEAFKKMDATPAEQLKGALNELKNSAIKLGVSAIPLVTKAADMLKQLVDGFNKLTPTQKENILKFGLMAAAMGPVLKVGGGLITTYGKLKPLISGTSTVIGKTIPVIGKLGTKLASSSGLVGKFGGTLAKLVPSGASAVGGLTKLVPAITGIGSTAATAGGAAGVGGLLTSLGGMAVAAAPFVAGAAAIGAAGYGIYKTLKKDVIPAVDLFKDKTTVAYDEAANTMKVTTVKISDETKKQVQSYTDLSNKAQQESTNMYLGITKVTNEGVKSITSKVDQMSNSVISSTKKQNEETIKEYKDVFAKVEGISDEQQKKVIDATNKECEERVKKVSETKKQLTDIYSEISKNGSQITEDQQKTIDRLYDTMKEQAIESMSQSKAEQETLLYNLNNSSKRITADMASDTIKKMNEIRDKSIAAAQTEHDKVVESAMKMKESKVSGAKETAKAIIESADAQLKAETESAEKIRVGGIQKLMNGHDELAESINVNTGNILSYWDKLLRKGETWNNMKLENKYVEVGIIETRTLINKTFDAVTSAVKGFNANGLSYVPFDGYNARLHKGERVLTEKENEEYTSRKIYGEGKSGVVTLNVPVYLNSKEFARATVDDISEELGWR